MLEVHHRAKISPKNSAQFDAMDVGQDINLNSPNKGLGPAGGADPLTDVPVEGGAVGVSSINTLPPGLTEEEAEEIRSELVKVEEEISTLRQVLLAKEKHSADLKRKLGLSPLNELKQNLTKGWQDVQTSNAYVRTTEKLGEWNEKVLPLSLTLNVYLRTPAVGY
uniref:TPD52 like 2 n=1 Tax=Oncorhynchus kisutch TaxID=8019 RepID=A0A8C7N0D1_ONCKI